MSSIKNRVQKLDPNSRARNIDEFVDRAGNVYEAIAIMSRRARILKVDLKNELKDKLEEFALVSDTIEEVQENKEQIEISKIYERLPNPSIIAVNEFLEGDLHATYRDERYFDADADSE